MTERNLDHTKISRGPQREIKILRILPSEKAFEGVSHSAGLGLLSGISIRDSRKKEANGCEHLLPRMVKSVSWSRPALRAWAPSCPMSRTRDLGHPTPRAWPRLA